MISNLRKSCTSTASAALLAGAISLVSSTADASVVRIAEENFQADAGLITFSEFALNTANPTYNPADYGGGAGAPVVTTGGFFTGQSLSAQPGIDCPGASPTGCVVGTPTGSLSLDASAPDAFITQDGSFPTSPTLSGSPQFNGPIALLFSIDQLAVGFEGGFFDAVGSVGITAFGRDGSLLGTVANEETGIEFLGLISATGEAQIAGVFLDLVGLEPAGYNIDNVRFGGAGEIVVPPSVPEPGVPSEVPLPAAGFLMLGGLAGMVGLRRRRRES